MHLLNSFLDLLTARYLLISGTAVLAVAWFTRTQKKNLPPCPSFRLPVLGNLLALTRHPKETVKKWREKHGDIISVYLGQNMIVMLFGHDLIKEALVKQADTFSDRAQIQYDSQTFQGLGIATNSGPQWKEERRVVISILRQLGLGKNWLGETMRQELTFYLQKIDSTKGEPLNLEPLNDLSFFNIFLSIIIGKRFNYDDEEFLKIVNMVSEMMADVPKAGLLQVFPFLAKIPGDFFQQKGFYKKLEDTVKLCSETFVENEEIINAQVDGEPSNFVAHYFARMRKKKESGKPTFLSKESLVKSLVELLSAGIDTTNTTLLWAILFLIHYPETQTKAFEEIQKYVGTDRLPNIEDKKNLKYLNAVLMETHRFACITPFGIPHAVNKDINFAGYDIPQNTPIFINYDSILLDPKTWGADADKFRPERFLDNSLSETDMDKMLAFGLGRRSCPGESYAKMELYLFMITLIQRYTFKPEDPLKLPPLEGSYSVLHKPRPFKVRIVPRS